MAQKNGIVLKRVSVKRGVRVIFFFREGCFSAKVRVKVDTNPNPKTACLKKKIDPASAPTPAMRFTDTLLTKAYLDDLNSSSETEAEKKKQTKQERYIRV